jgi:hypothetical protein
MSALLSSFCKNLEGNAGLGGSWRVNWLNILFFIAPIRRRGRRLASVVRTLFHSISVFEEEGDQHSCECKEVQDSHQRKGCWCFKWQHVEDREKEYCYLRKEYMG